MPEKNSNKSSSAMRLLSALLFVLLLGEQPAPMVAAVSYRPPAPRPTFERAPAPHHATHHQHRHQHAALAGREKDQPPWALETRHHRPAPWARLEMSPAQALQPRANLSETTTARAPHRGHHGHHQHQQHQHQQPAHQQLPLHEPAADASATTTTRSSGRGQQQPATTASTASSPVSAATPAPSAHDHHQARSAAHSLSPPSTFVGRQPRHWLDAGPKALGNRLDEAGDLGADYYYYDDDEDDDDDGEDEGVGEYEDEVTRDRRHQQHRHEQQQQTAMARGDPKESQAERRRQYLEEERLASSDQDYADDEPYRASAEHYQRDAPGVLTEQKFRELGTYEAVQQSRDKYLLEQEQLRQRTPAELAREHMDRMKIAGRCSRPLPRVIHVSNETSKRYVPYCTILHRCGEDTGCCDSTRQVCAAKSYEDIPVYFFVIKVNSRSNKRDTEVLILRNHTECHCVDRSNPSALSSFVPRDKRSDLTRRRHHRHQQQQFQQLQMPSAAQLYQDQDQEQDPEQDALEEHLEAANAICRCPKHFDVFQEDGRTELAIGGLRGQRCRCDCLSHNQPCRRLQSGEEGFAVDDRKCIGERVCQAPTCLHGDYSRQTGRCPRRRNHKRTVTRYDYGYG